MIGKILIGGLLLAGLAFALPVAQQSTERAIAQGQVFCQTRPSGTSDNSCASTAFVQAAIGGGGGAATITNGTTTTSGFTNTYVLTSTSSTVGQVIGSTNVNGVTCALGGSCTIPTSSIPNVSGSAQTTTGTISASSAALTLAAAKDFINGEGIRVNHAGAAFTASPPSGATVTPEGTTGSTTYHYEIASVDGAGGVGAVIAAISTTTGNASLTQANYNLLQWTLGSGASGVAVWKQISGTYTLIGLTNQQTLFADVGYTAYPFVDWLPTTAPGSALAKALVTTVSSGGGTTTLGLSGTATTAATSQGVYHDDCAAIETSLTSGLPTILPVGTFYCAIAAGEAIPSNTVFSGQFGGTTIVSVFLSGTLFTANNAQDLISKLQFDLVPGATAIDSTGGYGSTIDDIICNGGASGAVGTPSCVTLAGAAGMNLNNIALNGWPGAGQGTATGGMTPAIILESTSVANTLDHIILANDGQVTADMASIVVQNSDNTIISNSILAADLGSLVGTSVQGLTGVEFSGSGQVLQLSNVSILGYSKDISMDTYGGNSPQTLDITNSHLDFCGTYCIALNGGNWVNINNNSFVGEGNSPWDITENVGVWTSSSFISGPNTINGNTFNGFSGTGAIGIEFSSTMTNTTVCGNRYANMATNTTLGSPGSGSVYGCSTSP